MKKSLYIILAVLAFVMAHPKASAQILTINNDSINTDSVRAEFDRGPYFGLYKDNYFIFGTSIGPKP
ncbi:MAG: phospholipase, partial [Muribaculaceae bacterium]|nr:phospholipase [Muribaculaceae bacterium]